MKTQLLLAIISFILGGVLVWFIKPNKCNNTPTTTNIVTRDTLLIDTCLLNITVDTIAKHNTVKKGEKTKTEILKPEVLSETPSMNLNDTSIITQYGVHYHNGLIKIWDTLTVSSSKVLEWKRSVKVDTTILNTMIKTTERIVLQPITTNTESTVLVYKYRKHISIGAFTELDFNNRVRWGILGGYQTKDGLHLEAGFNNKWKFRIKASIPLITIKE